MKSKGQICYETWGRTMTDLLSRRGLTPTVPYNWEKLHIDCRKLWEQYSEAEIVSLKENKCIP